MVSAHMNLSKVGPTARGIMHKSQVHLSHFLLSLNSVFYLCELDSQNSARLWLIMLTIVPHLSGSTGLVISWLTIYLGLITLTWQDVIGPRVWDYPFNTNSLLRGCWHGPMNGYHVFLLADLAADVGKWISATWHMWGPLVSILYQGGAHMTDMD
jgi:hypothetical protein